MILARQILSPLSDGQERSVASWPGPPWYCTGQAGRVSIEVSVKEALLSVRWLLIEGADVIDGRGTPAIPATNVLIRNNRIATIGAGAERGRVPRGESVEVIDAAGRTLMPGLVDSHCHMTYGECLSNEEIEVYTGVETRT